MGKYYEELSDTLISWINEQHCFWVATAPLSPDGHVNVSPKGTQDGRIFHVVNKRACYYLDTSGSGCETISHLHEPNNGRLTISFSAFTGAPNIVRLWGHGRVFERGTPEYESLIPLNGERERSLNMPGLRAIIWLDIEQVGTSCGFSVPEYNFVRYRTQLEDFAANKQRKFERTGRWEDGYEQYWAWKNARSVDGMPGLKRAVKFAREKGVEPLVKFVGVKEVYGGRHGSGEVGGRYEWWVGVVIGIIIGLVIALVMQRADRYVGVMRQVISL